MSDLLNAFRSALSQAGPGLVAQIQGKDKIATELYKQGLSQAAQQKRDQDELFSNEMKMRNMALNIQRSKDGMALRQAEENRKQARFEQEQAAMREGRVDVGGQQIKFQKLPDTFNVKTNNPVQVDPTKREGAIFDAITGEKVDKVYTGVQKRFDTKDARNVDKNITAEMIRQTPVKQVLSSLDVLEDTLDEGVNAVMKGESFFGQRMGFTGMARQKLQDFQRGTEMFGEADEVDLLYEKFNSYATQILANQVRSFTGAQATDAERDFLAQMGPQPGLSVSRNRIRIKELRAMMQYIDNRNQAILARLGRPIKDVSKHIGAGQEVGINYYMANIKGKFGDQEKEDQKAALTPQQTQLLDQHQRNEARMIEIQKKLQQEEQ